MALSIPEHVGEWTVDDLDQFPESHLRIELHDGSLVVSPQPSVHHQLIASRLIRQIAPQLEHHLDVVATADLELGRTSMRAPDVIVISTSAVEARQKRLYPADVMLAVEIVSPGSRATDRLIKPAEYAAAGIPGYWRFELEPELRMFASRLDGGTYAEIGSWERGEIATLIDPLPVTIDVSTLDAV